MVGVAGADGVVQPVSTPVQRSRTGAPVGQYGFMFSPRAAPAGTSICLHARKPCGPPSQQKPVVHSSTARGHSRWWARNSSMVAWTSRGFSTCTRWVWPGNTTRRLPAIARCMRSEVATGVS